jgi:uncharacterized protein with PQ loop repeat
MKSSSSRPYGPRPQLAAWFLRTALIFVFTYAAISAFVTPNAWLGFIPSFVPENMARLSLDSFGIIQLALAAWLLSGLYLRLAALTSGIVILALTLTNLSSPVVTFRDVGLALTAFALAIL